MVHSCFKILFVVDEASACNLPIKSDTAELIRVAKLIIWDECSMAHKYIVEKGQTVFKRHYETRHCSHWDIDFLEEKPSYWEVIFVKSYRWSNAIQELQL